jgi:hypothetical protein
MYVCSAFFLYNYVDRSDNKMMPLWLSNRIGFRRIRTTIVKEYNYDFFTIDKKKRFLDVSSVPAHDDECNCTETD